MVTTLFLAWFGGSRHTDDGDATPPTTEAATPTAESAPSNTSSQRGVVCELGAIKELQIGASPPHASEIWTERGSFFVHDGTAIGDVGEELLLILYERPDKGLLRIICNAKGSPCATLSPEPSVAPSYPYGRAPSGDLCPQIQPARG